MKVLWFSPTSSLYEQKIKGHNGGGWISALESNLRSNNEIELAIAFNYSSNCNICEIDGTNYYPLYIKCNKFSSRAKRQQLYINQALKTISHFKPDLIQIFGSESWYNLLACYTDIPIIVHMQGSLPSYYNARYPVGISVWDKIFSSKVSLFQKLMSHRSDRTFLYNALQEERALGINKYYMGRTHWDKAIVELYNPSAKYYHCEEMIRDIFTNSTEFWQYSNDSKLRIVTTISAPLYKGVDVILKTARLLTQFAKVDFEWNICGIANGDFIEDCYGIKASDVNVNYMGVVSADKLTKILMKSTLYVHPSYIENSPNSVCEAQLLGIPVIATDVGGLASIVEDGVTGYLVPANDPVILASHIISKNQKDLLTEISHNERRIAAERHNSQDIINNLLSIYKDVIMRNKL